jgi:hypothetical protein
MKVRTTVRLTANGRELLGQMADQNGMTQTAVLEFAIRVLFQAGGPLRWGAGGNGGGGRDQSIQEAAINSQLPSLPSVPSSPSLPLASKHDDNRNRIKEPVSKWPVVGWQPYQYSIDGPVIKAWRARRLCACAGQNLDREVYTIRPRGDDEDPNDVSHLPATVTCMKCG